MRLLVLVPTFYGYTGEAINERQLVKAISKKVHKVYVVTFVGFKQTFTQRRIELRVSLPKNVSIIPVPIPQIHPMVSFAMISFSCLFGLISQAIQHLNVFDGIYIRSSLLSVGPLSFESTAERTIVKIPDIVEDYIALGHEIISCNLFRNITKWLSILSDKFALHRARRIAALGKGIGQEIIQRRGIIPKQPILIIPPSIDIQQELIAEIKRSQSIVKEKDKIVVGFLGSLQWWQGADLLAEAMVIVDKEIPDIRLLIVGDGEMRNRIVAICKESRIDYEITGFLSHNEALKYLSTFDVMVLPRLKMASTESILPLKVMEAWALGVPVLVTRQKVFHEKYREFEDVVYCEPEPQDIARAILVVLKNEKIRFRLSKKGPELAAGFSYQTTADKIIEEYSRKNLS